MTLNDYARACEGAKCVQCLTVMEHPIVEHTDHGGGWLVTGFAKRQWLYVTCSSCNYMNALWKLGVAGCTNNHYNDLAEKIATERYAPVRRAD